MTTDYIGNSKNWRERVDNISAALMVLAAVAAVIYQIFEKTSWLPVVGEPIDVLLFLVAMLTAGTGLQRLLHIQDIGNCVRRIEQKTEEIASDTTLGREKMLVMLQAIDRGEAELAHTVEGMNSAEILIGKKQIEIAAINLIDNCTEHDSIKATGQYFAPGSAETGTGLSDSYYRAIARKVALASESQGTMVYKVILPGEPKEERAAAADRRRVFFEELDVPDRMKVRYSVFTWPIEVLIAGKGMILAFSGKDGLKYNVGVKITDADFLDHMRDWYLETAWQGSSET